MNKFWVTLAIVLSVTGAGKAFAAPLEAPGDLVKDVAYNELQDRERSSFWQYRIEKTTTQRRVTEQQVETAQGPIFRTVEVAGQPLDNEQRRQDDERLKTLLHSQNAQQKNREEHDQDEARLRRLVTLMPQAFLYNYEGEPSGEVVTLSFRPNPAFTPSTYEARVFHALAGTLQVNLSAKRMILLKGQTIDRIDFGFGLLGHIEKGGKFEMKRIPVSSDHWKTQFFDVHLNGRVLFFKTIGKDERELRSGFSPVPVDTTLAQAVELLNSAGSRQAAAPQIK